MECYKDIKYLEYLDGLLKPREQASFKAHMEACAECRKVLHQLEFTLGYVKRAAVELPGEDYWPMHYQGIRRRIKAIEEEKTVPAYKPWHWRWWWAPKPALAAALSLLAVTLITVKLIFYITTPSPVTFDPHIMSWGKNLTVGEFQEMWSPPPAEEELQTLPPENRKEVTQKLLTMADGRERIPAPQPPVTIDDDEDLIYPSSLEEEIDYLTPEERIWLEKKLKEMA